MTEAIYLEVSKKAEAAKNTGRRVSVSGMLQILVVSRSGYNSWLHRLPSDLEIRREKVKKQIEKNMRKAAAELDFEQAAMLRDKMIEINKYIYEDKKSGK